MRPKGADASRYSPRNGSSHNKFVRRTNYCVRFFVVASSSCRRRRRRRKRKKNGVQGRLGLCINSGAARNTFIPPKCSYVHAGKGCRNEPNRMNIKSEREYSAYRRRRRGTCKFPCDLFLPFSFSFLLLLRFPPSSPLWSRTVPDLNIKGGLNLTYTTLNHVASIGL